MKKDPQVFLKHILESIEWIEKDTKGMQKDDFLKNVPIQDAVVRRIEIVGEAIRNLPPDLKKENRRNIVFLLNLHELFNNDSE